MDPGVNTEVQDSRLLPDSNTAMDSTELIGSFFSTWVDMDLGPCLGRPPPGRLRPVKDLIVMLEEFDEGLVSWMDWNLESKPQPPLNLGATPQPPLSLRQSSPSR